MIAKSKLFLFLIFVTAGELVAYELVAYLNCDDGCSGHKCWNSTGQLEDCDELVAYSNCDDGCSGHKCWNSTGQLEDCGG